MNSSLLMYDVTGCYVAISIMTSLDVCLALQVCCAVTNIQKQQKMGFKGLSSGFCFDRSSDYSPFC